MHMLSECLDNHRFWPYAAHLTAFFKRKKVPLDNELCKAISRSNVYNMNFLLTFMKFKLVDGVLQRHLVSPSSLPESQDQPSSQEKVIPPIEQAPSVEQIQPQSSSAPVVPEEDIQATSTVHTQEAPSSVCLPDS